MSGLAIAVVVIGLLVPVAWALERFTFGDDQ
jgi:hypothetical protein